MNEVDPSTLLHVSPYYLMLEQSPKNSHPALVLKALGCFLLGASVAKPEAVEIPRPGVSPGDLTETDVFEVDYSRFKTESYDYNDGRSVSFDQLYLRSDEYDALYTQAEPGFVSMVLDDEDHTLAQYIFALGSIEHGETTDCYVYCGWDVSEETLITDNEHLRRLSSFLDNVRSIILHTKLMDVSDLPEIELDPDITGNP